ncbi:transposase [Sphaerisporangium sp. NPDC051011]|uniref:transposase n=1 Tax=Sphaerisporangium sp. NPDC051011 TaxID=3155792 RepID=UPI0033CDE0B4
MFADLFAEDGRRSVPPMIVAVVMVLQRLEGLSDTEAVDRFAFDVRWKYAAGGAGLRSSRLRAHRAGGHARPAGRLRPAEPGEDSARG